VIYSLIIATKYYFCVKDFNIRFKFNRKHIRNDSKYIEKARKWIWLFAIIFLFINNISAQQFKNQEELKKAAQKFFDNKEFDRALPLYSQLLSNFPKDPNFNYKYGTCLLFEDSDKKKSLRFLEYGAKLPEVEPLAFFYLAKAYHMNFRFNEAIEKYKEFNAKEKPKIVKQYQTDREIEMCENGKSLVRTLSQLYVLDKKEVNPKDFFRSYELGDFGGRILAKPDDFKTPFDLKSKESTIMFFPNNAKVLYFSSYGEKGENGKDIYKVEKLSSGGWSTPILVEELSTPYDDDYPYLHQNGKVIYFSSKGFNSMGGYDIFKSEWNERTGKWSPPVNMEFPINSPNDDILFITDANDSLAYFASPRAGSSAKIQIYKIRVIKISEKESLLVDGSYIPVTKDGKAIKAKITVKNKATGELMGVYETNTVTGKYAMSLPKNGTYELVIESEGNPVQKAEVTVPDSKDIVLLKQEMKMVADADGKARLLVENAFEKVIEDLDFAADLIKEKSELNVTDANKVVELPKEVAEVKKEIPAEKDRSIIEKANETKMRGEESPEQILAKATERVENISKDLEQIKENKEFTEIKSKNIAKESITKSNDFEFLKGEFEQSYKAIDINTANENEIRALLDKKKELRDLAYISENLAEISEKINNDNIQKEKLIKEIESILPQLKENPLEKSVEQKISENITAIKKIDDKKISDYVADLNKNYNESKQKVDKEKSDHTQLKDNIANVRREISDNKILLEKTKKPADKELITENIKTLEEDLEMTKKDLLKKEFALADVNLELTEYDNLKSEIETVLKKSDDRETILKQKQELASIDLKQAKSKSQKINNDVNQLASKSDEIIKKAKESKISTLTSKQIKTVKEFETQIGFQELTAEKYAKSSNAQEIALKSSSPKSSASQTAIASASKETKPTETTTKPKENDLASNTEKPVKPSETENQQNRTSVENKTTDLAANNTKPVESTQPVNVVEPKTTIQTSSKAQTALVTTPPQFLSEKAKSVFEENKSDIDKINALSNESEQLKREIQQSNNITQKTELQNQVTQKQNEIAVVKNTVFSKTAAALDADYKENNKKIEVMIANNKDEESEDVMNAEFIAEDLVFINQKADDLLQKANNETNPIEKSKLFEQANLEKQKAITKQMEATVLLAKNSSSETLAKVNIDKNDIPKIEQQVSKAKTDYVTATSLAATQTQTSTESNENQNNLTQQNQASTQNISQNEVAQINEDLKEEIKTLTGEDKLVVGTNNFIEKDSEYQRLKSISENPNYDNNWSLNDYIKNSEAAMIKVVKMENEATRYKELSTVVKNLAQNSNNPAEKSELLSQAGELDRRAMLIENEYLQIKQFSEKASQKAFEMKLAQEENLTLEVSEEDGTITQLVEAPVNNQTQTNRTNTEVESKQPTETASKQQKELESNQKKDDITPKPVDVESPLANTNKPKKTLPEVVLTPEYEEIKQEIINTQEFQNWANINGTLKSRKEELKGLENELVDLNEQKTAPKIKKKQLKEIETKIVTKEEEISKLKTNIDNVSENLATLSQIYAQDYGFDFQEISSISEIQLQEYLETGKVYTPIGETAYQANVQAKTTENNTNINTQNNIVESTETSNQTETENNEVAVARVETQNQTTTQTPQNRVEPNNTSKTEESNNNREVVNNQNIQSQNLNNQNSDNNLTPQEKNAVKSSSDYAKYLAAYKAAQEKRKQAKEAYEKARLLEKQAEDAVKESEKIMSNIDNLPDEADKIEALQKATKLEDDSRTLFQQAEETLALAKSLDNQATQSENQEKQLSQEIPTAQLTKIKIVAQEEEGIKFPDLIVSSPVAVTTKPTTQQNITQNQQNTNQTSTTSTSSTSTALPSFISNNLSGQPFGNLVAGEAFSINPSRTVYSDNNPIPIDATIPSGVLYTVQVGAFRNPIPQDLFREFTPITGQTTPTGITRYRAGFFKTFRNADAAKNTIRGFGYSDAFVVALYNGETVSVARAREIEQGLGTSEPALSFNNNNNQNLNNANTNTNTNLPTIVNTSGEVLATFTEINNTQGLMFTVQIGVYSRPVPANQMDGISPIFVERRPNGALRYTTGLYSSRTEANAMRERMLQRGINDAFVTAFNNGQRITVAEAENLAQQNVKMISQNDLPSPTVIGSNTNTQRTSTGGKTMAAGIQVQVGEGDRNDERGMRSGTITLNRETGQVLGTSNPNSKGNTGFSDSDSFTIVSEEEDNSQRASAEAKKVSGLVFKVQIGAFKGEVPTDIALLFLTVSDLGIQYNKQDDGFTVYTVGSYSTIEEARTLKNNLSERQGFEGVFVVPYYDNARITLEEAMEKMSE
jgi:hypothetical protein